MNRHPRLMLETICLYLTERMPQDSSKLALLSQEGERGPSPCYPHSTPLPYGTLTNKGCSTSIHTRIQRHRGLCISCHGKIAFWENINYKRRHIITLCLQKEPVPSIASGGAVLLSFQLHHSTPHAHPHCLIRAVGLNQMSALSFQHPVILFPS